MQPSLSAPAGRHTPVGDCTETNRAHPLFKIRGAPGVCALVCNIDGQTRSTPPPFYNVCMHFDEPLLQTTERGFDCAAGSFTSIPDGLPIGPSSPTARRPCMLGVRTPDELEPGSGCTAGQAGNGAQITTLDRRAIDRNWRRTHLAASGWPYLGLASSSARVPGRGLGRLRGLQTRIRALLPLEEVG